MSCIIIIIIITIIVTITIIIFMSLAITHFNARNRSSSWNLVQGMHERFAACCYVYHHHQHHCRHHCHHHHHHHHHHHFMFLDISRFSAHSFFSSWNLVIEACMEGLQSDVKCIIIITIIITITSSSSLSSSLCPWTLHTSPFTASPAPEI